MKGCGEVGMGFLGGGVCIGYDGGCGYVCRGCGYRRECVGLGDMGCVGGWMKGGGMGG